jgi:hypothetical protein
MFILNNKPLSPDVAFTHNGIQYPANWLRLASPSERAAIGITEVADPPTYDQRFYWGPNNPKDLDQLKTLWKQEQKTSAGQILNQTDWAVIRSIENPGKPVSTTLKNYRASIRTTSDSREAAIDAATTVEELIEAINTLPSWPTL